MAKAMGSFRDSQAPSWLSGPGLMYQLTPSHRICGLRTIVTVFHCFWGLLPYMIGINGLHLMCDLS
jgi:hypothetical protein